MFNFITAPLHLIQSNLNHFFVGKEPWQVSAITASTVLFTVWCYDFLFQDESITVRAKNTFFWYVKKLPAVKREMDERIEKVRVEFESSASKKMKDMNFILTLPETTRSNEEVLKLMKEYMQIGEFDWEGGMVSGSVYYKEEELVKLVKEAYGIASYTNPLHPDVFPGVCKMEAEVIRMSAALFHGDENVCGTMTTGGTESILLACKAYRDLGKESKGIKKPEMIVPVTVHSAFDKAAQYFKIKVVTIPVHPITYQVDVKAMKKAITSNTILLVGSAPNFPYGTMDDIGAISDLGVQYNIPVHVDSCLGGFLTVFMADAGYPIPVCDFRLPGVTSISADTHKYGFAPKGTSLVLYRDIKLLHHQYTKTTDWPGGVYGSPTMSGSRAGGAIAAAWATLLHFGRDGYVNATRDIIHTTKKIEKGLRRINGIFIFGQPATSVIAIGSKVFDVYRLRTYLTEAGWNLNILQFPSGIHICVTHVHTKPGVAEKFVTDVQNGTMEMMKNPEAPVQGTMAIYGYAQTIPDRSVVGEVTNCYLDAMYYTPKST